MELILKVYFTVTMLSPMLVSQGQTSQHTSPHEWTYNRHPQSSGWDSAALLRLKKFVTDSSFVTGMMIVHNGEVVFEYGDVKENSYIASCRKSVLAMLYGEHVASGKIRLSTTIGELGMDDVGGLLPMEKKATIKDLISARSGVFHAASNSGDYLNYAPARGSKHHGTYWLYSNWDFNAAGHVFEKLAGRDIYDELERILVRPLHMQDWDRSLQEKDRDSSRSIYAAYHMTFSTRDMARIGQLMLNQGKWNNTQVIPAAWVQQMVMPHTGYREVDKNIPVYGGSPYHFGYGYMWWLWQNPGDNKYTGAYSAFGSMGQTITVCPAIETVIVCKTKAAYERSTSLPARLRILDLAVQSFYQPNK